MTSTQSWQSGPSFLPLLIHAAKKFPDLNRNIDFISDIHQNTLPLRIASFLQTTYLEPQFNSRHNGQTHRSRGRALPREALGQRTRSPTRQRRRRRLHRHRYLLSPPQQPTHSIRSPSKPQPNPLHPSHQFNTNIHHHLQTPKSPPQPATSSTRSPTNPSSTGSPPFATSCPPRPAAASPPRPAA